MKIDITSMFVNSKIEGKTATAAWGTSLGKQTFPCALYETPEVFNVLKGMIFSSKTDVENLDVSQMSKNREIILFSLFEKVFVNGVKLDDSSFIMLLVREHTESHDGRLLLSYPKYATYKTGQGIISNADAFDQIAKSLGCGPQGCWFVSDITIANQDTLLINASVVSPNEEAIYRGSSKERSDAWELLAKTNEALSNEIVRKALENDFLAIKNIPEENNELEMVMLLEKWYQKYKDRAVRAFGLKYGRYFIDNDISATSFIKKCSSVPESYSAELIKGINLYRDVEDGKFGLSFNLLNESNRFAVKHDVDEDVLQQIFFGAPGTGKSHEIKKQTAGQSVVRTTFHPDSDYSTFVGAYKPTTKEVAVTTTIGTKAEPVVDANGNAVIESKIVYEFVEQAFLKAYVNAWTLLAENKPQFLIVEEINRGNCAQIFGDLFQLLDRNDFGFSDYPITADKDLQKHLKKAFENLNISGADIEGEYEESNDSIAAKVKSGEVLLLPKNLYIWATMNTSDQSLFPIDSAFKRRWDWKYIPIDTKKENWSIKVNGSAYSWSDFLEKVNEKIGSTTSSEDKKLGFYFCKACKNEISADRFVSKVLFYIYNDVFKDYGYEDPMFKNEGKVMPFQSFYNTDGAVNEAVVEILLKNLGVKNLSGSVAGDGMGEPQN